MTGHCAITAGFRFVYTITKLDLDRRAQTRGDWTVDVDKFSIYYTEGM